MISLPLPKYLSLYLSTHLDAFAYFSYLYLIYYLPTGVYQESKRLWMNTHFFSFNSYKFIVFIDFVIHEYLKFNVTLFYFIRKRTFFSLLHLLFTTTTTTTTTSSSSFSSSSSLLIFPQDFCFFWFILFTSFRF